VLDASRSQLEAAVGVMELALLVLALMSQQYLIQKLPNMECPHPGSCFLFHQSLFHT